MSDNTTTILKKINTKIDELATEKSVAKEIKAELKELVKAAGAKAVDEQLENLNNKLDALDSKNASLKDSVYDFVSSTTKTLETLTKPSENENNAEKLNEFLQEIDKKFEQLSQKESVSSQIFGDDEFFKNFKKELTFFQNELEERLNNNLGDINETVTAIVTEVRNKVSELQEAVDRNSETLITGIISDIKQLKSDTLDISDSIRAIRSNSPEDINEKLEKSINQTQKSEEIIVQEVRALTDVTAKARMLDVKHKDAIETFKSELSLLRKNIHAQIREVLSKIVVQDEIKFLCEEAITGITNANTETGVVTKHLKELKVNNEKQAQLFVEIQNVLAELSAYELNEGSDKIDIIYENIAMLNSWASTSDKLAENFDILREDFDLNSDKIDIIYENLSFINEWIRALDKFAKNIDSINNRLEPNEKLAERIDDILVGIQGMKEWNKKSDALALQIKALSVQIGETESSVNSKNIADMKAMFAQLIDDTAKFNEKIGILNGDVVELGGNFDAFDEKFENIDKGLIGLSGNVSELSEDIVNLSSRTNKIILDTDKNNDAMRSNIENLQSLIGLLEHKASTMSVDVIERKVDNLKQITDKNAGFQKAVVQSFMYLAEWIDSAGGTISDIKSALSTLQDNQELQNARVAQLKDDFSQNFQQIEQVIVEQKEEIVEEEPREEPNLAVLDKLTDLTDLIDERIAPKTPEQQAEDENVKSMIDFIAAQVANINENSEKTEKLSKKIDDLEEKMNSIEGYLAKIVNYLEED